jgi:hypothetical protein
MRFSDTRMGQQKILNFESIGSKVMLNIEILMTLVYKNEAQ